MNFNARMVQELEGIVFQSMQDVTLLRTALIHPMSLIVKKTNVMEISRYHTR